jgi:hypothetical protein
VQHVVFDLPSGQVSVNGDEVGLLRDAGAARAGRSSPARDLSLLLDRALRQAKPVTLRRAERQMLIEIATIAHLDVIAAKLARSGDSAA